VDRKLNRQLRYRLPHIGVADADGRMPMPQGATPDAGNIMRPGTGGLY